MWIACNSRGPLTQHAWSTILPPWYKENAHPRYQVSVAHAFLMYGSRVRGDLAAFPVGQPFPAFGRSLLGWSTKRGCSLGAGEVHGYVGSRSYLTGSQVLTEVSQVLEANRGHMSALGYSSADGCQAHQRPRYPADHLCSLGDVATRYCRSPDAYAFRSAFQVYRRRGNSPSGETGRPASACAEDTHTELRSTLRIIPR